MKLETLVGGSTGCHGGPCPTVYQTDRDSFVVQGNRIDSSEITDLQVPSHESVVEIPQWLVRDLVSKLAPGH
jgi:hypothetical protein